MKKITEDRFCPKCGAKLEIIHTPNEKDFYTCPPYSIYSVNMAGDKYSSENGKRMYRIEYHCPTKEIEGLFCKKERSHYVLLGRRNLTD